MLKYFTKNYLIIGIIACVLSFVSGIACLFLPEISTRGQTIFIILIINSFFIGLSFSLQLKQKIRKGKIK
jgi:hypothetical protein